MSVKHNLYDALRILNLNNIISSTEHEKFSERVAKIPSVVNNSESIEITKKDFNEFERLRNIPYLNMYCIGNIIVNYSNILSEEKLTIILRDFDKYRTKFKG
ncbi:hypothetical protein GQ473_03845 [archaeon]|nr:hypothetical protein [archaeon]